MKLATLLPALSLVAVVSVAVPSSARAQVCSSDAECKAGTTCQVNAVPAAKPGCAGPDCPNTGGADVAAPDAVSKACAPAPCATDSDCGGAGMVCHTETVSSCSGGTAPACPSGEKCALPPSSTSSCTDTKVSRCAYKWQLPCSADADCGDGFTCAPTVTATCSGGSGVGTPSTAGPTEGSGGSSASDAPVHVSPPVAADGGSGEPTCTTTMTFPGYCQAKTTVCVTDADCPTAWLCVLALGPVPGGSTTPSSTTSSGAGATGSGDAADGGAGVPADLVANVKACQPPTAFPVRNTATDGSKLGEGSTDGGSGSPTGAGAGTGTPPSETARASGSGCAIAGPSSGAAPVISLAGLALAVGLVIRRRGNRRP